MPQSIDSLQLQVNQLEAIVRAQQSGLPTRLVVLAMGKDAVSPERVDELVLTKLSPFGLTDLSQAHEAGCEVVIATLPWIGGRAVGKCMPSEA